MPIETWMTYIIASTVLAAIPGPSVLMVIGQALSRGRRAAMICIAGDLAGVVVVMTSTYLGLGVILATSSLAFSALKWAGVAYMAWLGLRQILAARRLTDADITRNYSGGSSLKAGFLTGVLNPKDIMFYMAFLAQVIDPSAPQLPQFLILVASSTGVVALVLGTYALLAGQVKKGLRGLRAQKRLGYAGGSFLLGGSAMMAVTR